jgi:hypothetical protein
MDGSQVVISVLLSGILFIAYISAMLVYLPQLADANITGPLLSIGAASITMGLFVFFGLIYTLSTNPDSVILICLFLTTVVNLPLALFSFAAASSSIADAKRTLTQ